MKGSYRIASLNKGDEALKDISRYENELKSKTGKDIVLIAYSKDNQEKSL